MIELARAIPNAHMLLGCINDQNVNPMKTIYELIDNSFDAHAKNIEITTDGDALVIIDDGCGCHDLSAMIRLGECGPKSGGIGRYGVGMKDCAIWMGNILNVRSRCDGITYSVRIDWNKMMENQWGYIPPAFRSSIGPSFTEVEISEIRPGKSPQPHNIRDRVPYQYFPALKSGKTITYNDQVLLPTAFPLLDDQIQEEGFFQGKPWSLIAGMTRASKIAPWKYGFTVAFRDRLILTGSEEGTGDYSANRFFGYVEISEDAENVWTFDKLKHGMEEERDLLESLYRICEPILKKAQEKTRDVSLDRLSAEISRDVNSIFEGKYRIKEKRQSGDSAGASEPRNTGRMRERAERSDPSEPGSVRNKFHGGKIRVEFCELDENRLGNVSVSSRKISVKLNRLHSAFAGQKLESEAFIPHVIHMLSVFFLTHERDGQAHLSFYPSNGEFFDKFALISGDLMDSYLRNKFSEVAA